MTRLLLCIRSADCYIVAGVNMICLTHIPKTGGTTFRYILINNFSWRHVDIPNTKKRVVSPNDFPFESRFMYILKSLSGHWLRYSDHLTTTFPNMRLVVFVREPISRIVSLYYHLVQSNSTLCFREWAERHFAGPHLSNFQTRFIAGSCDVELAKDILENGYFFAGSLDLFDHSLLMLQRMLGNDFDIRYERLRSSPRCQRQVMEDPANEKILDKLGEYNELDFELIEYVKGKLFERYVRHYGKIGNVELDNFRDINRGFSFSRARAWTFRVVKYVFFQNVFRLKKMT